jgi:diguanylate cyclase (GGDEF)-like protein
MSSPVIPAEQLRALAGLPERPRLLVVDDQPINIQMLYQIFHDDYDVFMATSGHEALAFCQRNPPDLILLDVVMPGLDGHEVCRRLKADEATLDIPVLFITAQTSLDDETRAFEVGGVDFITKPVVPATVRARVKTHLALKVQGDLLRALVFIDGLTGVANRRRFDENLQAEWRRCRRSSLPLTLLMIDIDHFKSYNDHYGHQAGDTCLQAVAATLKRAFGRSHDLVARYGGEEFVCLMPECDAAAGLNKAEELCVSVRSLGIRHAAAAADVVSVSIGIATVVPTDGQTPADLLLGADKALYSAKSAGRNRCCVCPV